MVTQSFMAEYLSKTQISANDIKKSEAPKDNKSQHPFFKDVLNSAIEKPAAKHSYSRNETKKDIGREHDKVEDRKAQFKSYREAERSAEKDRPVKNDQDRSEEVSSVKSEKTDPKSKFKKAPVSEKEAVIENLAQVLGINQNDLMTLLGALNIKPEELMDPSKAGEIADKLGGVLGLNQDQTNTLARVISTVCREVGDQYEKFDTADGMSEEVPLPNETDAKTERAQIQVVKDPKLEFSELMDKFKAKLEELRNKINQNPQALEKDIHQQVEEWVGEELSPEIAAELKPKVSEESQTTQTQSKVEANTQNVKNEDASKLQKPATDSNADSKASDEENRSSDTTEQEIAAADKVVTKETGGNEKQQFNTFIPQENKNTPVTETVKVHKEVPVTKSEIIHQVVEKAKVTVGAEKSEMVMELRPESLGKLALKVVTERGMVVAHFVAESQQVKEALESNMQLLKDTLEKQGLSVQEFSVSVGQDSPKEFGKGEWAKENSKTGHSKTNGTGGIKVSEESLLNTQRKVNAYDWNDSSINLTA